MNEELLNEQEQAKLEELQAKYDEMKADIYGERLKQVSDLSSLVDLKRKELESLKGELQAVDAKIENTDTMKREKSWKQITDILDGKA